MVAQSIRRVAEDERYASQAIGALQGLPWKPIPERPDSEDTLELPAPVELSGNSPHVIPQVPTQVVEGERQIRRYYITPTYLDNYGWTEGCPARDKPRAKLPRGGTNHTPGCRQRIEAAVASDPHRSTRYDAARERLSQKRQAESQADLDRPAPVPAAQEEQRLADTGNATGSASSRPTASTGEATGSAPSRPTASSGDASGSAPSRPSASTTSDVAMPPIPESQGQKRQTPEGEGESSATQMPNLLDCASHCDDSEEAMDLVLQAHHNKFHMSL